MSPTCPRCGNDRPTGSSAAGPCENCRTLDDARATARYEPPGARGTLDTLTQSLGAMPRILLPDTSGGGPDPSPPVRPSSAEMPSIGHRSTRVQLLGEIARGGMGAVLKGRDPDLGRDLAVKVLLEAHRENPDLVRRFVEEAQIGGQLQHPGIVPVYELGTFGDSRPYFTMKLVKGKTLADLLSARGASEVDLPRFLGIFEQIAQTVAYAHSRGVIHRDLKPSNVMVGSFGEVQVMDWGLAKVLPRGGIANDAEAGKVNHRETVIATARSGSDTDLSRAGSIMGTPSYMAPEQARGEIAQVDERADVFSLGSILCEILTGQPAFLGRSGGEIQRKAALGETADALSRLDLCGADLDLISLARDCLAREPEDRPSDAGVLSSRATAYLSGVQDKLRTSERERAVAEATALEERKRRKLQVGLAATVLALATVGGLSLAIQVQQRQARVATIARVVGEATTLRDQALAEPDDPIRWQAALASARQAQGALGQSDPRTARDVARLLEEIRSGAEAADHDRATMDRLVEIRSLQADDPSGTTSEAAYADAFRDAGLDLAKLSPIQVGQLIRARSPAVALAISAALDDWGAVRRIDLEDPVGAKKLAEAADQADPDPWRVRLRAALNEPDPSRRKTALQELARNARLDELGPISLDQLGRALRDAKDLAAAESLLRQAQRRHPCDLWINHNLGVVFDELKRPAQAIRFYSAARAIRPETAHELGHALAANGERDEAITVFQDLVRLRPENGRHLGCLGKILLAANRPDEAATTLDQAIRALRASIARKPELTQNYHNLGIYLHSRGRLDEAVENYRELIRLSPENTLARRFLGEILRDQKKLDEANQVLREAIRIEPNLALNHCDLGLVLGLQGKVDEAIVELREAVRLQPDFVEARDNLADALRKLKRYDEAAIQFREALRFRPRDASLLRRLARMFEDQGKSDEALATFQEAVQIAPKSWEIQYDLGRTWLTRDRSDEALACFLEADRLHPGDSGTRHFLGITRHKQGKLDEAIAAYREAIGLGLVDPNLWSNLGSALNQHGKPAEAVDAYRESIRINPNLPDNHHQLKRILLGLERGEEAVVEARETVRLVPGDAGYWTELGLALALQGRLDEAIAAHREAIRLQPDLAEAHNNLGRELREQGKLDAAIVELLEALRLNSSLVQPRWNLSEIWRQQGKLDESARVYRELCQLLPENVAARNDLAGVLNRQGKLDEAVATLRESIRLQPTYAQSHHRLGEVLLNQAHQEEAALQAFQEADRLEPENLHLEDHLGETLRRLGRFEESTRIYRASLKRPGIDPETTANLTRSLARVEREAHLVTRLPDILKGSTKPENGLEASEFARICYDRGLHAAAARLWSETLASDPTLADDRSQSPRYDAACSAALAGSGQGKDEPPPDEPARINLRRQALEWLEAELASWSKILETGTSDDRTRVADTLRYWRKDRDLAGIREEEALTKLPESERPRLQHFWGKVDATRKSAESPRP